MMRPVPRVPVVPVRMLKWTDRQPCRAREPTLARTHGRINRKLIAWIALVTARSFIRVPSSVNKFLPAVGQQFSKHARAVMDTLSAATGRLAAQLILSVSARRPSWDAPAQNGATRSAALTIFVRFSIVTVFDCAK